jgi:hypothetical protein
MYCRARWIQPKLGSFNRYLLKREEWRFSEKSARPPSCVSSLKIPQFRTELKIRNLIANGAHNSWCAFCFTSDWPRYDENIQNQLPTAEWTFFDSHLSFFNLKSRDECSAPLERVSNRYWPEYNGACRSFSYCKWNLMAYYWHCKGGWGYGPVRLHQNCKDCCVY